MTKSQSKIKFIEDNQSLKNFYINKKYNKTYSSDYLNFSFVEDTYKELLEF